MHVVATVSVPTTSILRLLKFHAEVSTHDEERHACREPGA